MVRFAYVVIVALGQTACLDERYWVRPPELSLARIHKTTVEAVRDDDGRSVRMPAAQLLEVEVTPRADGRLRVIDRRVRLRHRRTGGIVGGSFLSAFGAASIGVTVFLVSLAGDAQCTSDLCRHSDAWGGAMIAGGLFALSGGLWLIVGGALTRMPREP